MDADIQIGGDGQEKGIGERVRKSRYGGFCPPIQQKYFFSLPPIGVFPLSLVLGVNVKFIKMKKMKKVLLFVWLMAGFMSVEAQKLYVMPEVGMSAVKHEYNPYKGYSGDWRNRTAYGDDSWRAAPRVGVGVMFHPKSETFAIQSGVYYTSQSRSSRMFFCNYAYREDYETGEKTIVGEKSFIVDDSNSTRHLLQVPLMARFAWRVTDEVNMFAAVGGSVGFEIGSSGSLKGTRLGFSDDEVPYNMSYGSYGDGSTTDPWLYPYDVYGNYYGMGNTVNPYSKSHIRKITWGLSAQVGIEYHKMVVTAGYDLDFGKESTYDSFGLHYQTLAISVGYKFRLK